MAFLLSFRGSIIFLSSFRGKNVFLWKDRIGSSRERETNTETVALRPYNIRKSDCLGCVVLLCLVCLLLSSFLLSSLIKTCTIHGYTCTCTCVHAYVIAKGL